MAQRLLSIVASSLRGMHGVQSVLVSELNTGRAVATSISGSMYSQPCLRNACSAAAPAQVALSGSRGFAANAAAKAGKPEFVGGKLKAYTSYKERFRMTATGKIRYQKPGHRHKRFVKGPKRNRNLRGENLLHDAYARVMKKLGFK